MTSCDSLNHFDGTNMGDYLQYNISTITTYGLCASKLKALQQWIVKNN